MPHLRGSLTVERRRHRYESNREYEAVLTSEGVRIAAPRLHLCRDRRDPHPHLFLGCQFHPEFKSNPPEPHPIFRDFIAASYQNHLRLTPDFAAEDARTSNT